MAKIKIGKVEYKVGLLSAYDLDIINEGYEGKKLSKLKQSFTIYLYTVKLYNPEIKITLEEFMKSCPLDEIKKVCDEFNEVTGVNFIAQAKI